MSGIAAVYHRVDPGADLAALSRLMAHLAWRGRDHAGTWRDGHVALGATQFWTTDEDWGCGQPAVSRDGSHALILDGRLDNRPELAGQLGLAPGQRDAPSDAQMALAAYERWGEAFAARLAGPFSVVVWDRDNRSLIGARDPLGQRPFYYRLTARHLHIASTIEALRSDPAASATLNDDYMWDYLSTGGAVGSFDPEQTPFAEIRRLPPGHTMVVTESRVRVARYWEPWNLPSLRHRDDREYAEHFREIFSSVVRAQTRAAGPVCATLSGGLDSSSIVSEARAQERAGEITGEPIQTLTLAWDEAAGPRAGYDEREYVDEVISAHPGPAHYLSGEPIQSLVFFDDSRPTCDEPLGLFSQLWSSLAEKTSEVGSRVLLAGSGGDHLLTGNSFYLTDLMRRGAARTVRQRLRAQAHKGNLPYPGLVAGYLVAPHLPRHLGARLVASVTKNIDRKRMDSFYYWSVPDWINDPAAQSARGGERHKLLRRRFSTFAAQRDFEQLELGSQDHLRLPLVNVALGRGVDLRNPFFDHRLADFCLRLPPHLKSRGGTTKVLLRLALQDTLPPKVLNRLDKTAYNFALTDHVKRNWMSIEDIYRQSEAQRHGYVNAPALLEAIAQLQQGGGGASDLHNVLAAFGLEDWLRRVVSPQDAQFSPASAH